MEKPLLAKPNKELERLSVQSDLSELNSLRKNGRHEEAYSSSAQSRAFKFSWPKSCRSETNGELEESMAALTDAIVAVRRYWQKRNGSIW
jgi:hypothetical protein